MSPEKTNTDPVVLLVSDSNGAEVGVCVDRLDEAGIQVRRATSVYAAAAELATRDHIRCVLLDIRSLDDKEMAIHRLIRRSYPDTNLIVPIFNGTDERAATYGPGIRPTPLEAAIAELLQEYGVRETPADITGVEPTPAGEVAAAENERRIGLLDADDVGDEAFEEAVDESSLERPTVITQEPEPVGDGPAENRVEKDDAGLPEPVFDDDPLAPSSEHGLLAEPNDADIESAEDTIPASAEALAYDTPVDASSSEESSREAYQTVRDKLAAELRSSAQRTPPRRRPPGAADEPAEFAQPQSPDRPASMLSPEEMDALMTNPEDDRDDSANEGGGA